MRTFKTICFCCLAVISTHSALAQERIDTDRPDQTESAVTVPKYYFQGEFGFGVENFRFNNYNIAHPDFLLKYGISKKAELRLAGNFGTEYIHLIPEPKYTSHFEPIEIGMKVALLEEKGIRPKTSMIFHMIIPVESPTLNLYPLVRFTFQNTLTKNIGLGYNVGLVWDGYDRDPGHAAGPTFFYTLSPNINIGKRWYAYIELFGFTRNGFQEHDADAGIAYYINNDMKLDLSSGVGLGDSNLLVYYNLGFSFRLPLKK
jgi:hypothetical protein